MVFSHNVPDHHIGVLNRAICRRPLWQPSATRMLVWIVPSGILLSGMIGGHPEMLGDKIRTARDTGLRVSKGHGILARQQLVGHWLAHRIERRGVGNQPGTCRGRVKPLLRLLLSAKGRSYGVESVAQRVVWPHRFGGSMHLVDCVVWPIEHHIQAHTEEVLMIGCIETRLDEQSILTGFAWRQRASIHNARELDLVLERAILIKIPEKAIFVVTNGGDHRDHEAA